MSAPEVEFVDIFRDEARERLDRIVETLLALEAGRAPPGAVDLLFREIHTIKGAAGMVGIEEVRALAHSMEDVLEAARTEAIFPVNLIGPLLSAADAIRLHVEDVGDPVAALLDEPPESLADVDVDEAASGPDASAEARTARRSIRVPAEKIDALLDLVGETVLHRRRLEHVLRGSTTLGERPVSDELDAGGRLLDGLKDAAIGMRTLPLSSIVGSLPRAVRDLALEMGKEVELVIEGGDTNLDRAILEGLSELLVHILRNAIAHGIEPPAERVLSGKPRCGRVVLSAEQRGGIVVVIVSDDGRGVSDDVLAEAKRLGSLTDVLTRPGFSTATEVTDISGRGVGLDIVKARVEAFGGTLEVRSLAKRGTEVILRLPLALALIEVLLVERAGNVYGIPLASVEEVVSVGKILSLAGQPAIELHGTTVALADLAELIGGAATRCAERSPAIILHASGRRVAAVCDTLLGKDEVIVKPLGPLLSSLTAYLGAAILGSSRVALLLDPAALVRASTDRPGSLTTWNDDSEQAIDAPKVLVVEDSLAVRELQRSILEAAGYRVETARDGRDALERLDNDETIALVLTDVDMPELDGFALTQSIRAHPRHSTLPVIVVTSRGDESDRRRGMEAGADAYMVKRGFDQQVLLETIERLIGK